MWNDVRVILDISKKKKKSYFRDKTRKDCETSLMTRYLGNLKKSSLKNYNAHNFVQFYASIQNMKMNK